MLGFEEKRRERRVRELLEDAKSTQNYLVAEAQVLERRLQAATVCGKMMSGRELIDATRRLGSMRAAVEALDELRLEVWNVEESQEAWGVL